MRAIKHSSIIMQSRNCAVPRSAVAAAYITLDVDTRESTWRPTCDSELVVNCRWCRSMFDDHTQTAGRNDPPTSHNQYNH